MKVYLHKLGCPKNDVDSDYIAARLVADGHEIVDAAEKAESVLVNTCGFIQSAKEESVDALIELGELKQSGNLKTLYATGCLSQRYGDEMLADMPELDGAFGHGALDSIAKAVGESAAFKQTIRKDPRKLGYLSWKDRFISDNYPYSYLKISDGCDRMCSYCAIPSMRGKFRSRPLDSIVNEARFLAQNGKKELILVSQEATLYGYDLTDKSNLVKLLDKLSEVDGIEWIRLLYLYPAMVTPELIAYMGKDNKTLPYFDIPLQHMSTSVLDRMRRQVDRSGIEKQLKQIRALGDKATLRTTFIVGFPGETEEEFDELRQAVLKWEFDRMGVFVYSAEEGTSAIEMPDQIDEETKVARMDELMSIQRDIALDRNNELIGTVQRVIIDELNGNGTARGRTAADCPEIDQEVIVRDIETQVGDIVDVKIESVFGYDLVGKAAG